MAKLFSHRSKEKFRGQEKGIVVSVHIFLESSDVSQLLGEIFAGKLFHNLIMHLKNELPRYCDKKKGQVRQKVIGWNQFMWFTRAHYIIISIEKCSTPGIALRLQDVNSSLIS